MARYIECGPISLEKLSLEHDILTYTTKEVAALSLAAHRATSHLAKVIIGYHYEYTSTVAVFLHQ